MGKITRLHEISDNSGVSMGVMFNGKEAWVPALNYPYFTTKGLPLYKKFNEKYWRPMCECGRIFDDVNDYYAHIIYLNSPYGQHLDSITERQ